MDNSELDQLAQATLELSQSFKRQYTPNQLGFDFTDPQKRELVEHLEEGLEEMAEGDHSHDLYPESPGLIYRLEKGASTFCVRGGAVESIADVMGELAHGNRNWEKCLRLEGEEVPLIQYFETDDRESAEVLVDHLINHRFPIHEDMLCNLSDPGFSWWLDAGQDHLFVYFKSHGIERNSDLIQLGPLGDRSIAAIRLNQLENWLRSYLSLQEFSCSEVAFSLRVAENSQEKLQEFLKLFTTGEWTPCLEEFSQNPKARTLSLYLKEISLLRQFWLVVQNQIQ